MMVETRSLRLVERLPKVRGPYRANVSLAQYTWFRVGGPAEILFRPEDADDLAAFMAGKPADVPVTVLGVGSNLLVSGSAKVLRVSRATATFCAPGPAASTPTSLCRQHTGAWAGLSFCPAFRVRSAAPCA